MAIPTLPDVKALIEAGVHFGHASGRWHPKMKPYIYATRDKLHIIDLEKTRKQLEQVLPVLEERVRTGKLVVLVGTKKQVAGRVKEIGEKLGIPYVNVRWLGGTLTNFREMQKSIQRMRKLETFLSSEEASTILKKERVMQEQELERMRAKFGGLSQLTRKPDVLFIIDPSHEHNAVKEARAEGLELFGVVDTNSDPTLLHHVIPANDDGAKSLNLVLTLIEETIASGQKVISVKNMPEEAEGMEDMGEPEPEIHLSPALVEEEESDDAVPVESGEETEEEAAQAGDAEAGEEAAAVSAASVKEALTAEKAATKKKEAPEEKVPAKQSPAAETGESAGKTAKKSSRKAAVEEVAQ
jgi:small subunit ribosomal protein S2